MKPILCDVPAFDKNQGTTGTFITNEQIYQHEIIIKDADAQNILYSKISAPNERLNRFVIPSLTDVNTIKNGCTYRLYIAVWKNENSTPYVSDPVNIKCASIPDFTLDISYEDNMGYTLKGTTLNVGVIYTPNRQDKEPEQLNEYYVTVTEANDNNNVEIYRSGLLYDINEKAEINDLENGKKYIVTAYGKTINGMEISTEPLPVNVKYERCEDSSVLTVTNDRNNARVILNSSIDNILYRTDKPPVYNPSSVDLTENALEYYDGFNLNSDFSMYVKYSPTAPDNAVINMNNGHIRVNFKTAKNYRLPLIPDNIASDGNSIFTFHNDGTMSMAVTKQYGGVWFVLPDEISGVHNFTKVTVKYKDGSGKFGYACRYAGESVDSDSDTVWNDLLKDSGIYEKTLNAEKKLARFKFFSIADDLSAENPTSVTITSVTFTEASYSLYQPYFELYTEGKIVIIDKNENGQPLTHIDTAAHSFNEYVYALKLARKNNNIKLKIDDWRR
ncbi:MAG: hypothetical protein HFH14_01590 [Lachnospiraceae bacterium]|nr:hypothetical protein [Lachnospiraceae bacterium]